MKVSRCFLFVLLPALSACGILGGGAATLSEKCYTDPQPKPSAQLALGGLQAGAETGAETRYVPGRLLVSYRGAADLHSTEQSSTEQISTERSSTEQQGDKANLAVQKLEMTARKVRQSYDLRSLGTLGAPTATELVRTTARQGRAKTRRRASPRPARRLRRTRLLPLSARFALEFAGSISCSCRLA